MFDMPRTDDFLVDLVFDPELHRPMKQTLQHIEDVSETKLRLGSAADETSSR